MVQAKYQSAEEGVLHEQTTVDHAVSSGLEHAFYQTGGL